MLALTWDGDGAIDVDRSLDELGDLGRDQLGPRSGRIGGEEDGELVSAEPSDGVGLAERLPQSGRDD